MALDGPGRARPTALLDEERKDRSSQAVGVPDWSAGSDRGGTGGSSGDGWTPSITQAAADSNTMPGYCAGPRIAREALQCSAGSPIRRLAQPRRACAPRDHEPRGGPAPRSPCPARRQGRRLCRPPRRPSSACSRPRTSDAGTPPRRRGADHAAPAALRRLAMSLPGARPDARAGGPRSLSDPAAGSSARASSRRRPPRE